MRKNETPAVDPSPLCQNCFHIHKAKESKMVCDRCACKQYVRPVLVRGDIDPKSLKRG